MLTRNPISAYLKPADTYYRALVIAAGLILLGWAVVQEPGGFRPWFALAIALFVAFQVNFPLFLLGNEISFIQVVTLGGALLYGGPTAAVAATLGTILGYTLPRLGLLRGLPRPPVRFPGWMQTGFSLGRLNVALLLALLASSFHAGLVPLNATQPLRLLQQPTWANLVPPLLLFAVLHGALLLIDFVWNRTCAQNTLRRDLIFLALIEFFPLPFIAIGVMGYSATGLGALLALGTIPVLFAILMHLMSSAQRDLERRLHELSTLNQISQVLQSTLDLEKLLSSIQSQVSELLQVDSFYVALHKPETGEVWFPLVVSNNERQNWPPRPLSDQLPDQVIRQPKPLLYIQPEAVAPSPAEYLRHPASWRKAGLLRAAEALLPTALVSTSDPSVPAVEPDPTAWAGVPLVSSERVIGCLALFALTPRAKFTRRELDLLTTLAGQISVGIENALFYDQSQRRAAQLETLNQISTLISASLDPQEVLAQVCRSVTQVVCGTQSAIFLLDPEAGQVWLAHAYGLSSRFEQVNGAFSAADNTRTRCLRTGHPALAPSLAQAELEHDLANVLSAEAIQAFGDFPLVTPEGQIGFLSVYFDAEHTFSSEEVELLQNFASQAAVAVSNARLHARTDLALSQRANQLSILEAVGRELAAAIHSDRLFEMILTYAREFTDSPWGDLAVVNLAANTLEVKASSGYPPQSTLPLNVGIRGRAVREKQAINVTDVRLDPDYVDLTNGATRSYLSTPLIHEGRVLGLLTLENPEVNGYSPSEQAFISQLVTQAAIAVVNAELYAESQRRLREQSTLYLVSTRLAGSLEMESVLQTIHNALGAALPQSRVAIYLWEEVDACYCLTSSVIQDPHVKITWPAGTLEGDSPFQDRITPEELDCLGPALLRSEPLQVACEQAPPALQPGWAVDTVHPDDLQTLVFPLLVHQQRLGMVVIHLPAPQVPQGEEMQLLQAILAQGKISLQSARLFSYVTHARDRIEVVLNSVREGIVMVEAGGRITLANESTAGILGITRQELEAKRLDELPQAVLGIFGYTAAEARALVRSQAGPLAPSPKVTLTVSDPKPERFIERVSLPVYAHSGRATGWIIVLRDVTEEHEIVQARELITETLVHDLRSPLSAVISALDVIEDTLQQNVDPTASQALQVAKRGAGRVLGMVMSLLEISRMQSGRMDLDLTTIDLHLLAATTLAEFMPQANEIGVILRNEIRPTLPRVCADQSKIGRVLSNLLDNALKFTPSGGQVIFSAVSQPNDQILFKVSDTGPGIPPEYQEQVFERFTQIPGQRGRRRGSGLGLTFCRLAVEAHSGRIWVEPRPGGGSSFCFTLPVGS